MSFFFASVSQFTSKIVNNIPFIKKQQDDFVIVPRHKYTQADLSDLSKKLVGIQQELRSMPDIDIKELQLQLQSQPSPSPSITALQRLNAELQEISELQQKNVETMKKLRELRNST